MNDLDKIIADSFQEVALPLGHEERFRKRLPKKRRRNSLQTAVVASVAMVLIAFMLYNPLKNRVSVSENSELAEKAELIVHSMADEVLSIAEERLNEVEYLEIKQTYNQTISNLRELEKLKDDMLPERYESLVHRQIMMSGKRTAVIIKHITKGGF